MADLNLDQIRSEWLKVCGSCDAGLTQSCVCGNGDPRHVIDALVGEVERLRKRVDEAHDALSRIDDGDDEDFNTLESTVDHVVRSYRNIAVSESLAADEIDRLRDGNANLIKNAQILADELIHANVDRTSLEAERDRLRAENGALRGQLDALLREDPS